MSSHEQPHHHAHGSCGKSAAHACPGEKAGAHLSCKEVCEFLMAFLDKELPPAQQEEFARHMAMCPPCAEYMRTYQDTIKLCKAAMATGEELVKPSERPPDRLINAILAARKK